MSGNWSDQPPNRRHTDGAEPPIHREKKFVEAMDELVPNETQRIYFIRDGIERELIECVYRHATVPQDGQIGRSNWIGRSALLLTEAGYSGIDPMLVFAHYEVGEQGVEIWLDNARGAFEAYEQEDDS